MRQVRVGKVGFGGSRLAFIAGPCVIESEAHCLKMAKALARVRDRMGIPLVFKASYDKANRTSITSYRGPGLETGLPILARVKAETGLPVLTDVHSPEEARRAGEVVDAVQVPAFLCRQTDLVTAAAKWGKAVNIKKGQFLSPQEMCFVVKKAEAAGNRNLLITERGSSFGYSNLVVDMRGLVEMRALGYPLIFDGTHSVQRPGAGAGVSGGERRFVPALCRAAVAVGVDGVFLEVHDRPERAVSDGPNMIPLRSLEGLLAGLIKFHRAARTAAEGG